MSAKLFFVQQNSLGTSTGWYNKIRLRKIILYGIKMTAYVKNTNRVYYSYYMIIPKYRLFGGIYEKKLHIYYFLSDNITVSRGGILNLWEIRKH